jgi:hypothetical protein
MNDVKDTYNKVFLKAAGIPDENISSQIKFKWWYNFRSKESGGLRLTEEGLQFIQSECKIKTYTIDFPKEFSFTPQVLIWLDNFIDSPYYITKKSITVVKEKAAFELYLFSGDIRKLGHNKALAKRLNQELTSKN